MRHLVLDTETTGLSEKDGHRIIEIGAIEMVNLSCTGRSLHLYINPERDIDVGAQDIHGLSSEFLADKPVFADILTEFTDFIGDDLLVIHNAPFDRIFECRVFTLRSPAFVYGTCGRHAAIST